VNPVTGTSDVQFGVSKPTVFNAKRNPVFVKVEQSFTISAQCELTPGGYPIDSAFVFLSQDYGPFEKYAMDPNFDTSYTYGATIPDLPAGTFVRYFIQAFDTSGRSTILAYQKSATLTGSDTSVAFFNFKVLTNDPRLPIFSTHRIPVSESAPMSARPLR